MIAPTTTTTTTAPGTAPAAGPAAPAPPAPPAVAPVADAPAEPAPALSPYERCRAAATANPAGDEDSDGISSATERTYHLDPCNPDSDGDGMVDGYEYRVALDLNYNGASLPYPGTGPWPRPWAATDGAEDFDGDGLTLAEEYRLWWFKGHQFPVAEYSDGLQASGGGLARDAPPPAPP